MDLISYLDVFRRRWTLVLSTVCLSLLVVWLTLPEESQATVTRTSYQASATLISNPTSETPPNLALVALFTTLGEVPERVAARLDYDGPAQVLAATVTTSVAAETGTLTITSTGREEAVARKVNLFAQELIAYFSRIERRDAQRQLDSINRSLAEYAAEIDRLDAEVRSDPDNTALSAERDGLQAHYSALVSEAAALEDRAITASSPIEMLQRAVPIPSASSTFSPPSSPRERLLIGGALGLLLGLALALVVERLDSRLRTREDTERALQLPVLAEIPARPWLQRKEVTVLSATDPGSATAEAYRSLRSAVLLLRSKPHDGTEPGKGNSPTVILVTSARPSEGKSSTVANLAAVMAESGRRVLVLSLDFRNPRIHDYLDVAEGSGLSDLLAAERPQDLGRVVRETRFPGVSVATSGQEMSHPGALLVGAGPLIEESRRLADIVLIDSAPMLAVSDAVDLSPHVDAVLVVSRSNRTTAGQARSAQRLLSRLGVPALGAVLIGGAQGDSFGGYPTNVTLSRQFVDRLGFAPRGGHTENRVSTSGLGTTSPKEMSRDD